MHRYTFDFYNGVSHCHLSCYGQSLAHAEQVAREAAVLPRLMWTLLTQKRAK